MNLEHPMMPERKSSKNNGDMSQVYRIQLEWVPNCQIWENLSNKIICGSNGL